VLLLLQLRLLCGVHPLLGVGDHVLDDIDDLRRRGRGGGGGGGAW
jgi:hypothetical protein